MPGFMGTLVSGAAAAFQGQELIADLDQKKANTENAKAEAQVRQMEVLQSKQKLQGAKDVSDWMKANATAEGQQGKDGVQQLQQLQAGAQDMLKKGDMYGYETMTKMAKEKTQELKDLHVTQEEAKATKLETLAQAASQFQVTPTPAIGEQMVKAAVDAGENPVNIPKPGTPQFAAWAKDKTTAAMSSSDKVKFLGQEADRQRAFEEKKAEHRDHEEDLAASRAMTASNQAAMRAIQRDNLEWRKKEFEEREDAKKDAKKDAKATANEKVQFAQADTIIKEASKDAKPYMDDLYTANSVQQLLSEGGSSAKDQNIRELLTSLHKSGSKNTALFYKDNKSFGATDDKISSFISHGITGRYSDEDRRQIYDLVQTLKGKVITPALNHIEKDAQDRGKKWDIPAEKITLQGDWDRDLKPPSTVTDKSGRSVSGSLPPKDYGQRPDGTPKGAGFFGEVKRPDGGISTELSVGITLNGKEVNVPTMVPGLTRKQMDTLMKLKPGEMPPEDIIQKAADFAKQRQAAGKSFFAQPGEEASVKLPTATPPKKGEVRKGYRYIGGPNEDEGDPKNWEKT